MVRKELQERLRGLSVLSPSDLESISNARIALVGLGGTGTHHLQSVARLGPATLVIIDGDVVSGSNLGRQILYGRGDVSSPKAAVAARVARSIDPDLDVREHFMDIGPGNLNILNDADVILDGTDNLESRHLINEFAVNRGIPWVYCGAAATEYMVMAVIPGSTPCFLCLTGDGNQARMGGISCTAGVIEPAVSSASARAVVEAIKIITGKPVTRGVIHGNAWEHDLEIIGVGRRSSCRVCVEREFHRMEDRGVTIREVCGGYELNAPGGLDIHSRAREMPGSRTLGAGVRMELEGQSLTVYVSGRVRIEGADSIQEARRLVRENLGF